MIKSLLFAAFLVFTQGFVNTAFAAEKADQKAMEKMADELKVIAENIRHGKFEGGDLVDWTRISIKLESQASLCVSNQEKAIEDTKALITGLGDKVKGEDPDVTRKRDNYKKQKEGYEQILAKCNLYKATSDEVSELITEAQKSYYTKKYLARSQNIVSLINSYIENPFDMFIKSGEFVFEQSGIRTLSATALMLSLLSIIVMTVVGVLVRRKLKLIEQRRQWDDHFAENFLRALLTTIAFSAPALLGTGTAALSSVITSYEVVTVPFITEFTVSLFIYFMTTTIIRLFFSPRPPAKVFVAFSPGIAQRLSVRLRTLAILGLVGYLAFYTVFSQNIIETNLLLLRSIFTVFVVINVVWTLKVVIDSPRLPRLRYLAMFVILVLIASLVAEWIGYRNLAAASRRVILLAFVALAFFILISKMFSDLYDAIDHGTYDWCKRLQHTLGVEDKERVPGLIWIRLLTTILIWGGFVLLVINVWDYSGGVIEQIRGYLVNGFDIGNFRIVPERMLWALLVFGGVIMLSGWFRSQLENNWLKLTNMDAGAKDAMVTIFGYVMFIIAFMLGLSAAGFDFGNLAIIAGALSVGIGFGLQNIVNNFVSGLILLFERPIRKGDWVEVNGTIGFVRDITIRSTRIETFDQSDVIVPNSELISNQVTNWMLSSRTGRAIIPVGVAYGSDVEKVRDILLEIGRNHPDVSRSRLVPEPKVLFMGFGDSSLNFELRVYLTDIQNRLNVISDINFQIDRAFREEGVEIPFPQRDLHIKSYPDGMPLKPGEMDENSNGQISVTDKNS